MKSSILLILSACSIFLHHQVLCVEAKETKFVRGSAPIVASHVDHDRSINDKAASLSSSSSYVQLSQNDRSIHQGTKENLRRSLQSAQEEDAANNAYWWHKNKSNEKDIVYVSPNSPTQNNIEEPDEDNDAIESYSSQAYSEEEGNNQDRPAGAIGSGQIAYLPLNSMSSFSESSTPETNNEVGSNQENGMNSFSVYTISIDNNPDVSELPHRQPSRTPTPPPTRLPTTSPTESPSSSPILTAILEYYYPIWLDTFKGCTQSSSPPSEYTYDADVAAQYLFESKEGCCHTWFGLQDVEQDVFMACMQDALNVLSAGDMNAMNADGVVEDDHNNNNSRDTKDTNWSYDYREQQEEEDDEDYTFVVRVTPAPVTYVPTLKITGPPVVGSAPSPETQTNAPYSIGTPSMETRPPQNIDISNIIVGVENENGDGGAENIIITTSAPSPASSAPGTKLTNSPVVTPPFQNSLPRPTESPAASGPTNFPTPADSFTDSIATSGSTSSTTSKMTTRNPTPTPSVSSPSENDTYRPTEPIFDNDSDGDGNTTNTDINGSYMPTPFMTAPPVFIPPSPQASNAPTPLVTTNSPTSSNVGTTQQPTIGGTSNASRGGVTTAPPVSNTEYVTPSPSPAGSSEGSDNGTMEPNDGSTNESSGEGSGESTDVRSNAPTPFASIDESSDAPTPFPSIDSGTTPSPVASSYGPTLISSSNVPTPATTSNTTTSSSSVVSSMPTYGGSNVPTPATTSNTTTSLGSDMPTYGLSEAGNQSSNVPTPATTVISTIGSSSTSPTTASVAMVSAQPTIGGNSDTSEPTTEGSNVSTNGDSNETSSPTTNAGSNVPTPFASIDESVAPSPLLITLQPASGGGSSSIMPTNLGTSSSSSYKPTPPTLSGSNNPTFRSPSLPPVASSFTNPPVSSFETPPPVIPSSDAPFPTSPPVSSFTNPPASSDATPPPFPSIPTLPPVASSFTNPPVPSFGTPPPVISSTGFPIPTLPPAASSFTNPPVFSGITPPPVASIPTLPPVASSFTNPPVPSFGTPPPVISSTGFPIPTLPPAASSFTNPPAFTASVRAFNGLPQQRSFDLQTVDMNVFLQNYCGTSIDEIRNTCNSGSRTCNPEDDPCPLGTMCFGNIRCENDNTR